MGTVYELSPNGIRRWSESVLYSFCAQPNCADWCASKVLDTADIVRDAMYRQLTSRCYSRNGKLESKLVRRNTLIPMMRGLPKERHEPEAGAEAIFAVPG